MSDTETTNAPTPQAVPAPAQPNGLTGAPAAIYTELIATPGATAAELALATGIGRSTAGKALVTLEEHGIAVRHAGGYTDGGRTPDRWHPAQPDTTQTPEAETADTVTTDTTTVSTAHSAPESNATPEEPSPDTTRGDQDGDSAEGEPAHDMHEPEAARDAGTRKAAHADSKQPDGPEGAATTASSTRNVRLAPGGLRQMVIDHLQARPGEVFTATRISRVIEKSSGAVANALVALTRQGIAEQVSDKPRTYRLTAAEPDTE